MDRGPYAAKGLATPILDEVQQMPREEEASIIETENCVPKSNAFEGTQQGAPLRVLECSTLVALHGVARPLLLETMGARAPGDVWPSRHFKNLSD